MLVFSRSREPKATVTWTRSHMRSRQRWAHADEHHGVLEAAGTETAQDYLKAAAFTEDPRLLLVTGGIRV